MGKREPLDEGGIRSFEFLARLIGLFSSRQMLLLILLGVFIAISSSGQAIDEVQPERPTLLVSATHICELSLNSEKYGNVSPPSKRYLKVSADKYKIVCEDKHGIRLSRTLELLENARHEVHFDFIYAIRFKSIGSVILDAERGVAWKHAGLHNSTDRNQLDLECDRLGEYAQRGFSLPSVREVTSLRSTVQEFETDCAGNRCKIHPIFSLNSHAMWVGGERSKDLMQIDFSVDVFDALRAEPSSFATQADLYCKADIFR